MGRTAGRSGERVLESRHLIGVFLGVVVLCCVFFTLGYVMGRAQYSSLVHAAVNDAETQAVRSAPVKPAPAHAATPAAPPPEWNFYPPKTEEPLQPAAPAVRSATSSAAHSRPAEKKSLLAKSLGKRFAAPRIPRGAIVLQLAALTRESDALALTDALQQKKYPAFVVAPSSDNFYRVQVGPYPSAQSASDAKRSLEQEGFKTITKY